MSQPPSGDPPRAGSAGAVPLRAESAGPVPPLDRPMGRQMIASYRNVPGRHCGSTAMRNLIQHYCGLELSEAEVFGLGSGIGFALLEADRYDPGVMLFGRSATMEVDVADALGLRYTEQTEADDRRAWQLVRDEVLAGRPTMLSGDALYLDYRDFKVHFPAHRFVLVGFDDDVRTAFVADRIDVEPQPCAYDALAASRNPKDFISTCNLWGRFHDGTVGRSLRDAFAIAVGRAATRMLERSDLAMAGDEATGIAGAVRVTTGIAGLDRLAEFLPEYLARPSGHAFARYAGACIETFGTGGGNFRLMYAEFLETACVRGYGAVAPADVETVRASARAWTALANQLRAFAGGESPASDAASHEGETMVAIVREIRELEARVFERLAGRALSPAASERS